MIAVLVVVHAPVGLLANVLSLPPHYLSSQDPKGKHSPILLSNKGASAWRLC